MDIYTELDLLEHGRAVELLVPFVGFSSDEYEPGRLRAGTFERYKTIASGLFNLSKDRSARVWLLPTEWHGGWTTGQAPAPIVDFLARARSAGRRPVVFAGHDVPPPDLTAFDAIVFSGAIDGTTRRPSEYSYPHFFPDLLEHAVSPRPKDEFPVVGFCGYAPPLEVPWGVVKAKALVKLLLNYLGVFTRRPGRAAHSFRARALIGLRLSRSVATNFRIKSTFAFGPDGQLNSGGSTETDDHFRSAYVANIEESDYTLCVRGLGNNSVRLFETLCAGRTPALLDTDCVLPLDTVIDWQSLCVIVPGREIDRLGRAIRAHHARTPPEDYLGRQLEARQTWESLLSPEGFFTHLESWLPAAADGEPGS